MAVIIESRLILAPADQLGRCYQLGDLRALVRELDARGFPDEARVVRRDHELFVQLPVE